MPKPVIGLTRPLKGGFIQNFFIRLALYLAGAGKVIDITTKKPEPSVKIQGLVVSGGTDVYPPRFKSQEIKKNYHYDLERDELESLWLNKALEEDLPLLAICRGAQLLNIVLGGSLHTDVSKVFKNAKYPSDLISKVFFRKKVIFKEESNIHSCFQKKESLVNSMHSQALNQLGRGLKVTAYEPNGIVQAVEHESQNVMGVQFHPEFLTYRKDIRCLFKKLVSDSKTKTL